MSQTKILPFHWKYADDGCLKRFEIIKKLFSRHEHLLPMLFDAFEVRMHSGAKDMRDNLRGLSGGEFVLAEIALAIWFNWEGGNIYGICRRLDEENFKAAMEAFVEYRKL